jgi:hypothetical protein
MWLTLFEVVCKLIGLGEWFWSWNAARQARKQAQAVANSPTTDAEWQKAAEEGEL